MNIEVRDEEPCDVEAIRSVTDSAFRGQPFTSGGEAEIVERLRSSGSLTVSLVARCDGEVVGHVALSPVRVSSGESGWYGLGPISVLPELQRKGIGSMLMHAAIRRLREMDARGCVRVGHPEYYGRFGFRADGSAVVDGVPAEVTFCLKLKPCLSPGVVHFHEAFGIH